MTVIIRDSVKGKLRQTIAPAVTPLCSPVQGYLQSDIQNKTTHPGCLKHPVSSYQDAIVYEKSKGDRI